jgi:hypothetical protein
VAAAPQAGQPWRYYAPRAIRLDGVCRATNDWPERLRPDILMSRAKADDAWSHG